MIDQLAAPADRLMSIDSATFRYLTRHGGIVTPDDPLPVIEQAARAYDVRWLVLERDGIVPALAPVLDGTTRPGWIGPVAYALPGTWQGSPSVIAPIFLGQAADPPGPALRQARTSGRDGLP